MENAVQKVVGAAGTGFAEGLAQGLVMIILIGIAILAGSFLFGFVFMILAGVARRKNKPKSFLVFGILSALTLGIFGGFMTAILTDSPPAGIIFAAPAIFIIGVWYVIKSYRKMGSGTPAGD